MSSRYELIVFDWDGTLMDSAAKIVSCFRKAAADVGVPDPGESAIRHIIGLGLTEALAELMPQADEVTRVAVTERYREHFLYLDQTAMPMFAGVREGLEALVARGYMLAIATGKSRRGLARALAESQTEHLFVTIRCADEALSKPHPRMLEDILDQTGRTALQTIMIGDTTFDLQMARNAGVPGLAVTYGVHAREHLMAEAPLACLDSFDEVCRWLP
jgi:phosphoglycolate phosphatase